MLAEALSLDHHQTWLARALQEAGKSPDPATRVGAVLINRQGMVVSWGCNTLPHGVRHFHERLHDRDTKLRLIVHAEMNAILTAARVGRMTDGCTLYLAATDDSGMIWGGPPCTRCTAEIIQAGISTVVSYPQKSGFSKWHADLSMARELLAEAGVALLEVPG